MHHNNYGKMDVYTLYPYEPKQNDIYTTDISANEYHEKITISFSKFNCEFIVAKKCEIMILNFEDDTYKPVAKDNQMIDRVKQWYDDCGIIVDFEPTNYFVNHTDAASIFWDDSDKILQDYLVKTKPNFINTYIPLALVNNEIINQMANCDIYPVKPTNRFQPSDGKYIRDKLNIVVPEKFVSFREKPKTVSSNKLEKTVEQWYTLNLDNNIDTNSNLNSNNYKSKPIEPYNSSFLSSDFARNCHQYMQESQIDPVSGTITYCNAATMKKICVILNYKFFCTKVLINPDKISINIVKSHHEYGFLDLFEITTDNSDIIKCIKDKFDNVAFDDANDINKHLQILAEHIVIIEEHAASTDKEKQHHNEEAQVKQFFEIYYEINDNIENKMKASQLCDIITNSFLINIKKDGIASFRNRLSRYLADIGLKKKRFNDGFYYYGIKQKAPICKDNQFKCVI